MKNNYNPYTVPENFFENTCEQAITGFRCRRRAIRYGVAAMVVAAALLVIPLFVPTHECQLQETETVSDNLAVMYEYDIFLQVNFSDYE